MHHVLPASLGPEVGFKKEDGLYPETKGSFQIKVLCMDFITPKQHGFLYRKRQP